ncbi:flagellar biosynthesis protein FlgI [Leptospira perolatii]|uniref:Flagellar P-ring protein n=1 Tax=Leptospira perolatii TaxID=2023191 RepID=A0A2M9ZR78_9LEPT|nr:flagellar basal body P-ring protein FlgI [Leptospira perolatii]PJZ70399.1 flagellar biosynthesis protein FlgI [Leptospira perolatii]PJZ74469.1 flagellar biosynthesis protein FlgI [Leptospira perolatii]
MDVKFFPALIVIFLIHTLFSFDEWSSLSSAEVRLKEISNIEGIRDNQLTGYGIVVGLPGTGDTKTPVTTESMKNYLKNLGVDANLKPEQTRNIASVLITANIPSYSRKGDRIDVTVSSIGDAKSLEGGVLLQSPLRAGNDKIFAVASGVISFGGKANNERSGLGRGTKKTVGIVHQGAIVESELNQDFFSNQKIVIRFHEQDFSQLNNVIAKIKEAIPSKFNLKSEVILPLSPSEILINIGSEFTNKSDLYLSLLADLENLTVDSSTKAKVVINERSGVIVMGGNIVIDEVAVSRSGLSLSVADKNRRNPKLGQTQEAPKESFVIEEATQVSDVVDALNKVGASTRDIIAILEALKKAGALHAELEVQ